ncbi:MAG: TIGR00730 family Rossman fold protein [Betaproteobacteria bacterium]|nr:TIGR00730 family Rossman fold protein [Betaproteobacteria bacterium]
MADPGAGRVRSVCLFCSAREPLPEAARTLAAEFGAACAAQRWRLVYGGSSRGLMGVAARAAVLAGGDVLGIMPRHLERIENAAAELGTLTLVDTRAERKQLMAEAADLFVALPGGIGTLDETAEMLTLNDLGLQEKPVLLCASDGFWQPFAALIERFDAYGVLRPGFSRHLRFTESVDETVRLIREYFAATGDAARESGARRSV